MSILNDGLFIERLHVELTSRCNFRCITCRHGFESFGEDLSDEVCNMLINKIIPNLKEIELQGTGESLLCKNFNKIFHAAKVNNCRINLITNASLLNQELIKEFVESNMQLVISLDGANESTFRKHRPVGDFNEIIANLNSIKKYKDSVRNGKFSIAINTVITKLNYIELNQMIDLASLLHIDFVFASEVRECMPDKKIWEELRLDNHDIRDKVMKCIKQTEQYAKHKNIGFYFNPYKINMVRKKDICISPWKHLYLYASGDISICCELNAKFGNINKVSIIDVLNGERLNSFRNNMLLREYDNRCLRCCLPWGIMNE